MYTTAAPAMPLPDRATLSFVPDGPAGTMATLKRMRGIVIASKVLPEIRNLAAQIVAPVAAKDWAGEAVALQQWVQNNIRYLRDVRDVETLTPPVYTLGMRAGDCDDQSMLLAALLESIGHETRLVAFGAMPGVYSHVLTETKVGPSWYAAETIHPWPLGKKPAKLKYRLVVHV